MPSQPRPTIAIYPQHYLTVSMTFIYRQLLGVADEFAPVVLASSVEHLDLFPFEPLFPWRRSLVEKIYCRIMRKLGRKHAMLSPPQSSYWRRVLAENDTRLIHAHFGPAGLEILPIAKSLEIPLLVTFHGFDASSELLSPNYRSQLRELFDYAHIITVSQAMANRLFGYGAKPERTHVHYIGVPVDDFQFVAREPVAERRKNGESVRLLQVSNFVEKKGHRYTVQAFKEFLTVCPNSILTFAGDGPLKNEISALSDRLGLGEKVRFIGKVTKPEVVSLMSDADIFVHHSVTGSDGDQEGIPTVLMEAMATGLIVVSTHHSGIPELIEDGSTGFLAPEKDIPGYVAKMVEAASASASVPQRAAQVIRENWDMARQNSHLKDFYRDLMRI